MSLSSNGSRHAICNVVTTVAKNREKILLYALSAMADTLLYYIIHVTENGVPKF